MNMDCLVSPCRKTVIISGELINTALIIWTGVSCMTHHFKGKVTFKMFAYQKQ
jgi:hypothetical protein